MEKFNEIAFQVTFILLLSQTTVSTYSEYVSDLCLTNLRNENPSHVRECPYKISDIDALVV